jgi:hypothetical protein
VLPNGWQRCRSNAIEAFRYLEDREILQLLFVGRPWPYDYPCPRDMYERFLAAPSKGRFHNEVLQPHAKTQGWSPRPRHWPRNEALDL